MKAALSNDRLELELTRPLDDGQERGFRLPVVEECGRVDQLMGWRGLTFCSQTETHQRSQVRSTLTGFGRLCS